MCDASIDRDRHPRRHVDRRLDGPARQDRQITGLIPGPRRRVHITLIVLVMWTTLKEIGCEERLRDDLFCVEWDAKPYSVPVPTGGAVPRWNSRPDILPERLTFVLRILVSRHAQHEYRTVLSMGWVGLGWVGFGRDFPVFGGLG